MDQHYDETKQQIDANKIVGGVVLAVAIGILVQVSLIYFLT
jgi:hypothetical protein